MDLGAIGGLCLAQASVQQRQFVADIATQHNDLVGVLDLGQRHAEHFGNRGVGEIAVVDAVVDVVRTQASGQAGQQCALLVRRRRVHQHAELVATVGFEDFTGSGQAFGPAHFLPLAIDLLQRLDRAISRIQALVRITVTVRQPALVDQLVVTRHGAQHFAATHVQEQVGTHRVVVTQRLACGQFPRTCLELEYLVGQRTDRAHVDDVAGQLGGQGLAVVGADLQVFTARHATQLVGASDFSGEAHAAGALDAAGHLGGDQRPHVLVDHNALALVEAADRSAVAQRHVLQLALATLIADWAVQRVVDEQELHHRTLVLERLFVAGLDLHAIHDRGGTGRRRLGRLFNVDQAHAAVGGDRQLLVVAEARNRNAGLVGGLDDHRTLGYDQGLTIDIDGHMIRRYVGIYRLRAHAAAASTFLPSTIE